MEGDSELEDAADLYAVDMSLPRLQSGSSPGSPPPGRGRAGCGRGISPRSATPNRGTSSGGSIPGRGTPSMRGASRSIPPGLPVDDPPRPSRLQGFLSGRGGSAVRGKGAQPRPTISNVVASTSSGNSHGLKRLLPSFSSDDNECNTAEDDDRETDNEVSFKPARKQLRTMPAAKKNLNLIKGNQQRGRVDSRK